MNPKNPLIENIMKNFEKEEKTGGDRLKRSLNLQFFKEQSLYPFQTRRTPIKYPHFAKKSLEKNTSPPSLENSNFYTC